MPFEYLIRLTNVLLSKSFNRLEKLYRKWAYSRNAVKKVTELVIDMLRLQKSIATIIYEINTES